MTDMEGQRHHHIEIQGAKWGDWEETFVILTDANGNFLPYRLDEGDPTLVQWVADGGVIQSKGTPDETLAYWRGRKCWDVQVYADRRLEDNEPGHERRARIAKINARVIGFEPEGYWTDEEQERTRFDAATLRAVVMYCNSLKEMTDVDKLRAFDPEMAAWPKHSGA